MPLNTGAEQCLTAFALLPLGLFGIGFLASKAVRKNVQKSIEGISIVVVKILSGR